MVRTGNYVGPEAAIAEYIEACRVGSAERLRNIFHPGALMSGYYQGEFYLGSPSPNHRPGTTWRLRQRDP